MKSLLRALSLISLCYIILSCEKEPILYKGEENNVSGIYFYAVATTDINGNPLSYTDSTTYSFQNDPESVRSRVINLNVRTLGNVSSEDRPFHLKITGGTAVEGIDFEKIESQYFIPAGAATLRIPIRILRTDKLLDKAITIDFQLVENEHFKLLLPNLINIGNNQNMDATRFRINFSEIINEPSYFNIFGPSYFGDWSVKKFKLINQIMEWKTGDWLTAGSASSPVALGRFAFAANMMKTYLENKLAEEDPVYEADGKTFMQLGPSYMVDYSGW